MGKMFELNNTTYVITSLICAFAGLGVTWFLWTAYECAKEYITKRWKKHE